MQESLDVLLGDHLAYHTTLQCRAFITTKSGVTPYGMYRQALRELDGRTWAALDEMLEVEALRLKVSKHEAKSRGRTVRAGRKHDIKAARARLRLEQLQRRLVDRFREWAEFYGQACALREQLGLLPGQPLDAATRDRLDMEFWLRNLASQIAARIHAQERALDGSLVELIRSLPDEYSYERDVMLTAPTHADAFLDYFKALPVATLPEPTALPNYAEVEQLIRARYAEIEAPTPTAGGLLG